VPSQRPIAKIDWSGCPIVRHDSEKLSGAPTIRGWRITPDAVIENYEAGLTPAEISEQFDLPAQDTQTVIDYALKSRKIARPA